MHDELVGYLCGALEVEEITLIERSLDGDEQLRSRLEIIRLAFLPLECDREECCPPDGLAKRFCEKLRSKRN